MAYPFKTLNISKIAVIGAGQIGPDIALHFAKSLSPYEVEIVVVDISVAALALAESKIEKKIKKAVETGAFKVAQAEKIKNALLFSINYESIKGADIVVEAATENTWVKDNIFQQVETLTDDHCIFLSNSSHLQPEVIFENIRNRSRCLVAHYFFPAEINPVVEIVPGAETDPALTDMLLAFYESIGKIPIQVKSAYGYAVDPIFEGLCQTAIQCLEKGWGNEKEIDAAAVKALGLGVGPFTALNLTGGNPITAHGLDELGRLVLPWFKTPALLHEKNNQKEPWETAARGETVTMGAEKEAKLVKTFQGAFFALSGFILDTGIVQVDDLNLACEMALVLKAPFTFMNAMGIKQAHDLASTFCAEHPGFPMPKSLDQAKAAGGWKLRDIVCKQHNQVLFITIRRPRVMNALNLEVLGQIRDALEAVKVNDPMTNDPMTNDPIRAVVITGFGIKAFVSGADLNMITSLKTPEEGVQNSRSFQAVLNYVADYPKPIVCAMNGFAFGGGNELAMACTARIAKKGLPVIFCQPEVNLGFIPGAGGTQRLPRIIGVEKAAEILRTGRPVAAKEALELGFIQQEAEHDLLTEAAELVLKIANGQLKPKPLPNEPMSSNGSPKALEIGHLSKKIDEILVKSIYEGSRMSLQEGLALESKLFGNCMQTEDMKIGLENFKTNGPKTPAHFIHQ
ncbi:MAG: 3-hydroxyacyl-CoA dehydrogenase/enoyl-CoA hydratase family protein [Saprospiraceae bacterium]|nr:3-hydroxyacyl-CoA dehydrogenase/enoyl-CoA hydratase family protein [Saprospiraceae bacterium]